MKAKVKASGAEIEVQLTKLDTQFGIQEFTDKDGEKYQFYELEFLPDIPEEVTIQGYVARDKSGPTDLGLRIYTAYPKRMEGLKRWNGKEAKSVLIDHRLFPEVTWESEPLKVKLTLTPME